jgi:hypothetical protein
LVSCLDGRQPLEWIGRLTILAHFEVQVRSGAEASVARIPEELSLLNTFVWVDSKLPQVAVDGGNASTMQEDDHVAIGGLAVDVQDDSISGRKNR